MVHDDQTARSSYLTTDSTGMLKTAVADDDSTSLPNGHALPQSHDASATPAQERGSEGPATMDEKGPVVVESAEFKPDWMFYAAFSSLSIVTLMVALDATSISVALPIISRKLHGTAIEAFWSGTSFLLTSTIIQPVVGSFSHIFGRKPVILTCMALFGIGALVAGLAHNFTVILVGRSIQGTGGGGIIALTEIIVTDIVPLRERGKWFSFISIMWAVGSVGGPLIGGVFAQKASWRWIFWINFPFIGLGVPAIVAFLHLSFRPTTLLEKLRRVDWLGIVLFVASITGFLIPLTWGGVQYDWTSWHTLVPLVMCAVGLVAFVVWEERFAVEPMIRMRIFKNRTSAIIYLGDFLHGVILWCALYYLPLYYQAVKGFHPVLSGVAVFPETFTVAPASVVVGVVVSVTGQYRWAVWLGWLLTTLGAGLMILLDENTSTAKFIFENLALGLGTGMLFPGLAIAVQAAAADDDQAYAATLFSFFRTFGQAVGVAIGGVIFQNQLKKKLLNLGFDVVRASEYARDAAGLVEVIQGLPDGSPEKLDLRKAYASTLQVIWLTLCIIAAFVFLISFFIKALPLDRQISSEQRYKARPKSPDSKMENQLSD